MTGRAASLLVVAAAAAAVAVLLGPRGAEGQKEPNYAANRTTMVHLFEWRWTDVADECERFLGPRGFAGVQVSPVQENVLVSGRPWWERYQPVSYRFETRSGTEAEFRGMVARCNRAGVRVYVDVLLNHMSGDHANATGTGGSTARTAERDYPAVPYDARHFHRACAIEDYRDAWQVRNCELVGLHDLDQSQAHVRDRLVELLDRAIDAGVAGFRVDAAKHMRPEDLAHIYARTRDLPEASGFAAGSRAFFFQEVSDFGSEAVSKYEYSPIGAVTEFRYGSELSNALLGRNPLKWFSSWGEAWALLPSRDALVFCDNHDTQRSVSAEGVPLTHKQSRLYKMAVAFMLAHPYGLPRVMSSFAFAGRDQGPPADSPRFAADGSCLGGWVCEHRWRQIYNMAGFRNYVADAGLESWWDNGNNQIGFCRGERGFVAINAEAGALSRRLRVCLPPGTYCDLISGELRDGRCTGKSISVDAERTAWVEILPSDEDGVVAFHAGARAA